MDYSQILVKYYPNTQWVMNGNEYSGLEWLSPTPKPTQEELDALWVPYQESVKKQNCKQKASELLYETDWTTIPDVADSSQTPYLTNQSEFILWRSQIRALAVNPVVDPVFPSMPEAIWG